MSNVVPILARTCDHTLAPIPPKSLSTADIMHLQRQRRLLSQTLSDLRNLGGNRMVVMRADGSVLSNKTGAFEFNVEHPFEVSAETDPKLFAATAVVTQEEAVRNMANTLGGYLVAVEKRLRAADAL